jgi:hypothetical protein
MGRGTRSCAVSGFVALLMLGWGMNRAMLIEHLQQAEAQAAGGVRHIERQRRLIVELERDAHDVTVAKDLLATYLRTQELHEQHRDRLGCELGLSQS